MCVSSIHNTLKGALLQLGKGYVFLLFNYGNPEVHGKSRKILLRVHTYNKVIGIYVRLSHQMYN